MPVYRYKLSGVDSSNLGRSVPGSLVVGSSSPFYLDVTATVGAKTDLDEYMAQKGFAYSSQDPTTSPTTQGALEAQTGVSFKQPCRVASTANLASLAGLIVVDGVTLVAGDRVLVKSQTVGANNGIYVAASGSWTRATDFDSDQKVKGGLVVAVSEGLTGADSLWILTTDDPIVVGTTALSFIQVGANTQSVSSRWKDPCRVTTSANILTLSGLLTIGGITLSVGDRVLVKDQTTGSQNGIYVVSAGAWTRATDANDGTKMSAGTVVYVNAGAPGGDGIYALTTNDPIVVGTTALTFELMAGDGGGNYGTYATEVTTNTTTTSASFVDLLSVTFTKKRAGTRIKVTATSSFTNSVNNTSNYFRTVIDGVAGRGAAGKQNGGGSPGMAIAISSILTGLAIGTHTIKLQWKCSSGTLSVQPEAHADYEHAALIVEEVG